TIVIPPPNVTGVLHMGHMLNNTLQDALIRKARLEGKNACWVPGTDHASIATEAKVVKMLRQKGIKKSDISREEFLRYAFEWKDKYGGIILDQLQRLGASCDWERTRFTMEEKLSKAVIKVFVDLYKKGKIYRGLRMTNWDPAAKTVLSNEEVIYGEEKSHLHFVRYKIDTERPIENHKTQRLNRALAKAEKDFRFLRKRLYTTPRARVEYAAAKKKIQALKVALQTERDQLDWITIATTRPETILGDTAIAINPKDTRYTHLRGRRALVPLLNRSIPIIFDNYVEMDFGTGALKVTPAHDMNDYEIGQRHNLETIDVFNDDGTMSEAAQMYVGEDRFEAKRLILKDLEASDNLIKIEPYLNKVGRSERTNVVVEPRLTLQWFMDMKDHAKMALDAVKDGDVTFYPEHFINMYRNWLDEDKVRDWCISRQLWWGQQIPAYFLGDDVFVAETAEEALDQAKAKTNNNDLTIADLRQDEDVVDTWFSSWLWPISVFDGFEHQEELKYYYPTNVLITGWDIIYLWVARMIMAGYEWSEELLGKAFVEEKGRRPFKDVYFTGMVRDEQRRKMSKSLGNSPDALALIDNYGADGVRFGMLASGSAGNDIIFDAPFDKKSQAVKNESKLCQQGAQFCNKMWNAMRMLKLLEKAEQPTYAEAELINPLAKDWIDNKFNQLLETLEVNYKDYRLGDALMNIYNFMRNDFFSEYLEMIKPPYGEPLDYATFDEAIDLFEKLMTILHPFMPFVTEEIWHLLKERADGDDCIISKYPQQATYDQAIIKKVDTIIEAISKTRAIRKEKGMKEKAPLQLFVQKGKSTDELYQLKGLVEIIKHRGHISELVFTDQEEVAGTIPFISGTGKYFLESTIKIDVEAEKEKLQKELDYNIGFVASVEKKLSNERFVQNAPAAVVAKERKKLEDGQAKIKILRDSLDQLN
ncbi:MAG: valine--tRNA ligase, partial [Bacteroidota bacterium]